ncbi:uncharacterized protein SPPG_00203 [Spizellomyces punctatus DAOM BR117]|uniref:Uncharacterized protein n=1 Tax=Spizellomyces punctatus (strain DAOM BR117) TaxID=645134 RepID=A0A0L0HSZ1_SPIPD|nr:uncharacterized protein SPPG_00203 [Spizellomyces punctatus DAOM BR117]KND04476.1 hypothetical protein SPPG_00203 [Spizellomyces punctatus DAOM BR117]|eukprot:XP_016612515.1 hypothetical protein SPPG_00203 [Spizellomyces punctatus DAOM BR117]
MALWFFVAAAILLVGSSQARSLIARQVLGDTSLPANITPLSTVTVPMAFTFQDARNGIFCGTFNITHNPSAAYWYPSTIWTLDIILTNSQVWWISNAVADIWQENQGGNLRATPINGVNNAVQPGGWVQVAVCYDVLDMSKAYGVVGTATFGTSEKIVVATTSSAKVSSTTASPTPTPTPPFVLNLGGAALRPVPPKKIRRDMELEERPVEDDHNEEPNEE